MSKIDEIRKRRESFPWETEVYDDPDEPFWGEMSVRGDADMNMGICIGYGEDRRRFVTFMAAAPEDISFLLAEVSRLESERDAAREGLRIATKMNDEAEPNRVLGAKVRACIATFNDPHEDGVAEIADHFAVHLEDGTMMAYQDQEAAELFRSIADALREEGGR